MFGLPSLVSTATATATTPTTNKRYSVLSLLILALALMLVASACSEGTTGATATLRQTNEEQHRYPEPPPPMTSATQILSGGWLITGDGSKPQFDAIVVIRDGLIVAVGMRGTIEVPADSVGIDASGKWILPGSQAQLTAAFGARKHEQPTQFTSSQLPAIAVGRSADLVLLNSNPLIDPQALNDVHAIVSAGQVDVLSNNPS